jgi:hypothetical protein
MRERGRGEHIKRDRETERREEKEKNILKRILFVFESVVESHAETEISRKNRVFLFSHV